MRHPKTPATLRIKVAFATQPYIHPRKSNRPTTPVAAAGDRHGFEVEPALAKATGSGYAIAAYIAVCAIVSIIATALMPDYTNRDISEEQA
jgi:hypothetical protein